ncbi:hypothetical protein [Salinibacterium sp. TMP30]|uniref:hypothetical protein n=1 Tax=Salinibacterium sp. TMP30 TaxID=3138237 RepID=UPI0031399094
MATGNKNIDPRFDPAFQRGYSESNQSASSDAVRAARTVDSLRDDAADAQYSRTHGQPPTRASASFAPTPPRAADARRAVTADAVVALPPASGRASDDGSDSAAAVTGREEQRDVAPQSHYVGAGGALSEIVPAGRGKSLARNPWIYVLWIVGVVVTAGGVAGQMWAYSQLYSQTGLNVEDYGLITGIQGLAPIAATVGALSLVGALIVHALNWMRRNP